MARATGLARGQQRALDRLKRVASLPPTYLAGGVAVAFHLGHRRSRDLDLFTFDEAPSLEPFRALTGIPEMDAEVIAETDVALHLRLGDTPIDVVRYRYPLLDPTVPGPRGWPVPSLRDLAAMKLAAIARRGLRRDFWDLMEIVRAGVSLESAGAAYRQRFGRAEADLYHVYRALTFFDDAEREESLPEGMSPRKWREVRSFFEDAAPGLLPR